VAKTGENYAPSTKGICRSLADKPKIKSMTFATYDNQEIVFTMQKRERKYAVVESSITPDTG
jgi:hypothetical protein